ncbi:ABC-2 transporter permease [candidate division KSB1 bacterium]
MFSLIKKDFIAGKIFLLGVLIIIPLVTAMAIGAMADEFRGLLIGVFSVLTFTLCIAYSFVYIGIDTANNADMIYAGLPVKKSTIVYARYFTSMFQASANLGLVYLTCFITISILNKSDPIFDTLLNVRTIISMNIFLLLILSIILPFVFKSGIGSGLTAALVTLICIILCGPALKFVYHAINGIWDFDIAYFNRLVNNFLRWIIGLQAVYVYLIIFSSVFIIIFASMRLSVRLYKRRDL